MLAADAFCYGLLLFVAVDASLQRAENAISLNYVILPLAMYIAYVLSTAAAAAKIASPNDPPASSNKRVFSRVAYDFAVFMAITVLCLAASGGSIAGGQFGGLTFRWRGFLHLLVGSLLISPVTAVVLACMFCMTAMRLAGKRIGFPVIVAAVLATSSLVTVSVTGAGINQTIQALAICALCAGVIAAALTGRSRAATQFTLAAIVLSLTLWTLSGILPANYAPAGGSGKATRVFTPSKSEKIYDITPCADSGRMYYALGRDGIVLHEIKTGRTKRLRPGGDIRVIQSDAATRTTYAYDTQRSRLYEIPGCGISVSRSATVSPEGGIAASGITVTDSHINLRFTVRPVIHTVSKDHFSGETSVNFRNTNATPYREGAFGSAYSGLHHAIYAVAGLNALNGHGVILRLDPVRMKPVAMMMTGDAGGPLVIVPGSARAYMPGWRSGGIIEMDLSSMKTVRTLDGPMTSRALAYDELRDILYSGGAYDGTLWLIDALKGTIIRTQLLCNGISDIERDPATDSMYVSCAKGVYRVRP